MEKLYLGTVTPPIEKSVLYLGTALPSGEMSEPLPPYPEGQYDYSFDIPQDDLILTYTSGYKAPRYRVVNDELLIDYDGAEPNLTIYASGELIYNSEAIPHTELPALFFNGKSYFNTGFIPTDNTYFKIKATNYKPTGITFLIGSRQASMVKSFITAYDPASSVGWISQFNDAIRKSDVYDSTVLIESNKVKTIYNGKIVESSATTSLESTFEMYVGTINLNNAPDGRKFNGIIESPIIIKDNDVEVRHYIAVLTKEGVYTWYDKISETYVDIIGDPLQPVRQSYRIIKKDNVAINWEYPTLNTKYTYGLKTKLTTITTQTIMGNRKGYKLSAYGFLMPTLQIDSAVISVPTTDLNTYALKDSVWEIKDGKLYADGNLLVESQVPATLDIQGFGIWKVGNDSHLLETYPLKAGSELVGFYVKDENDVLINDFVIDLSGNLVCRLTGLALPKEGDGAFEIVESLEVLANSIAILNDMGITPTSDLDTNQQMLNKMGVH